MTLDEAIKHCKEKAKEQKNEASSMLAYNEDVEPNRYKTQCLECAKEHEQLASWLEELKARRESDRWIPVSERLPKKEGVKCLVKTDFGDVCEDKFVSGAFVLYRGNVIAWKPLPEPYKESEDNK